MNLNFYNKLTDYIEAERIYREEPMKKHTTFRVGGNADYFVVPKTEKEVERIVDLCKEEGMSYASSSVPLDKYVLLLYSL